MKITNKDRKLFSEIVKKHGLKKEGILLRLFKRKLKDKIAKDKDLQKTLKDADKKLDNIKKAVKDMKAKGYKVPPYMQKYLK
tara:strand:- start:414 stop:659 length:246 start_codon:yes stop_codon:yes gene_type:complete